MRVLPVFALALAVCRPECGGYSCCSLASKSLYTYCCQIIAMKNVILLLMLLLVACAPAAPSAKPMVSSSESPVVETKEEIVSPAQQLPPKVVEVEEGPVPGTPLEVSGSVPDPYSELGCESLLTAQEFADACGKSVDDTVVSYKIGTRNCFVSVKDRLNERLTAGISLTGYEDGEKAAIEFDRRLTVLKVGADKSVGERAYVMPNPPVDRVESYFLRNEFLVQVGTDVRLCSEDGMLAVARLVDGRIS